MSGKPSDVLDQLVQVHAAGGGVTPNPPWFNGHAHLWQALLLDTMNEIKKNRAEIADLSVMRESYSRLYKQIYGDGV